MIFPGGDPVTFLTTSERRPGLTPIWFAYKSFDFFFHAPEMGLTWRNKKHAHRRNVKGFEIDDMFAFPFCNVKNFVECMSVGILRFGKFGHLLIFADEERQIPQRW